MFPIKETKCDFFMLLQKLLVWWDRWKRKLNVKLLEGGGRWKLPTSSKQFFDTKPSLVTHFLIDMLCRDGKVIKSCLGKILLKSFAILLLVITVAKPFIASAINFIVEAIKGKVNLWFLINFTSDLMPSRSQWKKQFSRRFWLSQSR